MKKLKSIEEYNQANPIKEDSYADIEDWVSSIIAWFKKETDHVDKYDKEYKIAQRYASHKHAMIGSLGVKDGKIYLTLNNGPNRPSEAVVLDYHGDVVDNDMPREVIGKMKVAEAEFIEYAPEHVIIESLDEYIDSVTESADVNDDCDLFAKKFSKVMSRYNYDQSDLDKVRTAKGRLKTFLVVALDEDGRRTVKELGLVNAINDSHARLVAAITLNDPEIYLTGFYSATEVTKSEINKKVKEIENLLAMWTNIHESKQVDEQVVSARTKTVLKDIFSDWLNNKRYLDMEESTAIKAALNALDLGSDRDLTDLLNRKK